MPEGFIRSIKNNKISGPTVVDSIGKQLATIPKEFVSNLEISHIKKACTFEKNEKNIVTKLNIEGKEIQKDNSILEQKQKEIEQNKIKEKEFANQKAKEEADRLEREKKRNTDNNPSIQSRSNPSYPAEHLLLPSDTKSLINVTSIDNFALRLFKSGVFKKKKEEYKFELTNHLNPNFNSVNCKGIAERQLQALKLLFLSDIKSFKLATDWRMALGLGNESVYETSITLHHIYGIPYIPASAIKGVVRSWIITNCFADEASSENPLKGAEERSLSNELFCYIFGSPKESAIGEHQGKIIFVDAFPANTPQIKVDIMNPHYGEYYSSEGNNIKPPGDYYNPVPIPFLAVENTTFQFIIGIKNDFNAISEFADFLKLKPVDETYITQEERFKESMNLLDLTSLWLKLALTEHGIGAKTAVGYGYMK